MGLVSYIRRVELSQANEVVPVGAILPLQIFEVRTVGPANHQFSLLNRALSGKQVGLRQWFQADGGRLGVIAAEQPDWVVGDSVVVSGSSNPAYNTTHVVADVNGSHVIFDTAYAGDAFGGVGVYQLTSDLEHLYTVLDPQSATGAKGFWEGNRTAMNMDVRMTAKASTRYQILYFRGSLPGKYVLNVRGRSLDYG